MTSMTMYVFRCNDCGPFDASFPIGTAPDRLDCPDCAAQAVRRISAPRLNHGTNGYGRAIERAAASADRPQVVKGAIPGMAGRPTQLTRNPLHAKLPRP